MFNYSYKIVFIYTNYVDKHNIMLMLLISTYLLAKNELYVKKQHYWHEPTQKYWTHFYRIL